MKPFKFYLVTDTHYFEPSLGCSGKAYDDYTKNEMYCLAEASSIVKATVDEIIRDTEIDTVIIPGDLSKNGEKQSHYGFIRELNRLKDAGKKVYVITAGHDFNDNPHGYVGEEHVPVEPTSFDELFGLYYDFGLSDALAIDKQTHSYVAEVAEGIRMIAFNCDSDRSNKGCIDERLQAWAKEQIDKAKADGCFIFCINHYPIIPSVPLFDLIGDAHIKEWRQVASFLADNGVNLALTGHMHIQSINEFYSDAGNKFVDICTSILVGSPGKYRKITIEDENTVIAESINVPEFDWDKGGMTTEEYFDDRAVWAAPNRIRRALSGDSFLKKKATKIFNTNTFAQLGRKLCIGVPKEIRDKKFAEFTGELARDVFKGDQPYVKGTPIYTVFAKVFKRFRPIIKIVEKKLTKNGIRPDLTDMLLNTIGNNKGWSDNNATIKLK